jgi:transcriptional regulator with PAS, ATPase and Fis domain
MSALFRPRCLKASFLVTLKEHLPARRHRTGAILNRRDSGTLFLDEIGEMPIGLQTKLLRVLEEKSFYPLAFSRPVWVDVRVVSASNRNIDHACQEGNFRLDLLFRLKSVHIHLPPLRERSRRYPLARVTFSEESLW